MIKTQVGSFFIADVLQKLWSYFVSFHTFSNKIQIPANSHIESGPPRLVNKWLRWIWLTALYVRHCTGCSWLGELKVPNTKHLQAWERETFFHKLISQSHVSGISRLCNHWTVGIKGLHSPSPNPSSVCCQPFKSYLDLILANRVCFQ